MDPERRRGGTGGNGDTGRHSASDGVPELGLDDAFEHHLEAETSRADRQALGAILAVGVLLFGALAVANLTRTDPGPSDEAAIEVDDERQEEDEGDEGDEDAPRVELRVLGPRDGLDSKGHPVAVTPDSGLVEGQVVTVTGSGFPPNTDLGVVMCSGAVEMGGGSAQCQLAPFTPVQSDATGTFTVEFPVRRIVTVGGQEIDCADHPPEGIASTCVIAVGAISDYDESGVIQVWFDASVPPPPAPEINVSPTDGLIDGQVVTVSLDGVEPDAYWWPSLCTSSSELFEAEGYGSAPPDDLWCEHLPDPRYEFDAVGSTSVDVEVHRVLNRHGMLAIDCAEAPGRCWIQVWAGPRQVDTVTLTFDPASPIREVE
jgi:hypothetical protein